MNNSRWLGEADRNKNVENDIRALYLQYIFT
jgi:hypothetical protein